MTKAGKAGRKRAALRHVPADERAAPPGATSPAGRWRPAPFVAEIGWAASFHAGFAVVAVLLAFWSPYVAGFALLFGAVILMIAAPATGGSFLLSLAAITAGAGATLSVWAFDRAREIASGEIVTLASAADAPKQRAAAGFRFADAKVAAEFTGFHVHRFVKTSGEKRTETTVFMVAPLVAANWTPQAAVPAWATCKFEHDWVCARMLRGETRRAAILARTYDREHYYPAAVADAEKRHGLASVPGAPLLALVDDLEAALEGERRLVYRAPFYNFALWGALFLGWRLYRLARRT